MLDVDRTIAELIDREAGYVDHPKDRGGPTRWGITEQVARAHGYDGPMRDLPRETAREIYLERYWAGPRFDLVALRAPAVAEELLDTGVNMGPRVAGRFLQRALNVLNRNAQAYPDILVDGDVGRMTLHALDRFIEWRGAAGLVVLLRALDAQQAVRYIEIAEARPSQEEFVYGWVRERTGALT